LAAYRRSSVRVRSRGDENDINSRAKERKSIFPGKGVTRLYDMPTVKSLNDVRTEPERDWGQK